jgi:Calcineurin-like phosphoesterase.
MKNKPLVAQLLVPLLASCGNANQVAIARYFERNGKDELVFHEGYKVLQLTDIHWSVNTDMVAQGAYLTRVVEAADPDFIMITGDSLLGATTSTGTQLLNIIESWKVPYAVTWGNHDREGEYSPAWLTQLWSKGQYSYYNEVDDNVFGRSNYVVPLVDGTTRKAVWNLYSLDSNSYPASDSGLYYDYDVIHDDQVAWFNQAATASTTANGAVVPGLAFFHIPLFQWFYGYVDEQKNNTEPLIGEVLETSYLSIAPEEIVDLYESAGLTKEDIKVWAGYKDTGLFDAGVANGVKGFFCGHDHSNDWGDVYTDPAGSAFIGYGVKTGTELYYSNSDKRQVDMIGGSLLTLHSDESYNIDHIFVPVDETAPVVHDTEDVVL